MEALKKERVTEAEVRSILRSNGVVSIASIEAVVMESNGQFTVVKEGNLTSEDSPLMGVKKID
ncbi:YetF domain-containing protein [Pedobacter endophyticus]|uniref:YetF domain-containing protein n=1 Tax=Pedobacter endophyticus TaxID=2789740 RepID=UPI001E2A3725|nr:YetF domain-containing protein [Pedobacter endophyticus]